MEYLTAAVAVSRLREGAEGRSGTVRKASFGTQSRPSSLLAKFDPNRRGPLVDAQYAAASSLIVDWLGKCEIYLWTYGFESAAKSAHRQLVVGMRESAKEQVAHASVCYFHGDQVHDRALVVESLFLAFSVESSEGCIFSPISESYAHFGDGSLLLFSADVHQMDEARALCKAAMLSTSEL